MTFVEDSLVLTTSDLTHHGKVPTDDKELTPTLENLVVLLWLHLINNNLPGLVNQRYGTELRLRTLASIKHNISQAIGTLLATLQTTKDGKIMQAGAYPPRIVFNQSTQKSHTHKTSLSCPLCQSTSKISTHYPSKCLYLPNSDQRFLTKSCLIAAIDLEDHPDIHGQSGTTN